MNPDEGLREAVRLYGPTAQIHYVRGSVVLVVTISIDGAPARVQVGAGRSLWHAFQDAASRRAAATVCN